MLMRHALLFFFVVSAKRPRALPLRVVVLRWVLSQRIEGESANSQYEKDIVMLSEEAVDSGVARAA